MDDDDGLVAGTGVASVELGEALARLRKQSGLTGEGLGERIGMSQSKVSKIEQGRVRPSVSDVERIAKALRAPEATVASLVDLANRVQASPRRPAAPVRRDSALAGAGQQEYLEREARSSRIRSFEVMTIPGLLQISEYSRRVYISFFDFTHGDGESRFQQDIARAVAVRAERQVRIYDPDRTFEFVMLEAALSTPLLTPGYMLAQIDRLEFASQQPNVTIRIIPNRVGLGSPAANGFTVLDEDAVLAEVGHSSVYLTDELNINYHRRLFDYFSEIADPNIGPILTKYKTIYADEARPKE